MQIDPGSPKITYVRTDMHPINQVLHILGQPGRFLCRILSPRTLQALAVMLLGQWRLISRLPIGQIVGQINLKKIGWSWCVAACYCHLGTDAGEEKAG